MAPVYARPRWIRIASNAIAAMMVGLAVIGAILMGSDRRGVWPVSATVEGR
jgi:hypothetical protein